MVKQSNVSTFFIQNKRKFTIHKNTKVLLKNKMLIKIHEKKSNKIVKI